MVSSKKESIDLIEAFIDTIWMEKGLSSNTLSSYKQDLLSFSSWLPNKDLVEADKSTILDYLSYRLKKGYSSRSTSRCLSSIRAFYKYLLFNYYISKNFLKCYSNISYKIKIFLPIIFFIIKKYTTNTPGFFSMG